MAAWTRLWLSLEVTSSDCSAWKAERTSALGLVIRPLNRIPARGIAAAQL